MPSIRSYDPAIEEFKNIYKRDGEKNKYTDMKAIQLIIAIVLFVVAGLDMVSCNSSSQAIVNNISFKPSLSKYALFESPMLDLKPVSGIEVIDLGSTLFTDYAEKQRLLKVPEGQKVIIDGDGLPLFPDGTLLAKTFYYSISKRGKRQIIETRLLILKDKIWNAATYRWNDDQTDADLLREGSIVPITFTDHLGKQRSVEYKIPSENDCISCHQFNNELTPLGPKTRNLNIEVKREGVKQNQLAYFMNKGIFKHVDISSVASLPDYHDSSVSLSNRTRAYFDINCGHCHRPTGLGKSTSLNLEFETPYDKTGIDYNEQNILMRMSKMDEYHMPKIGTTIIDEENLQLVREYIKSLEKK